MNIIKKIKLLVLCTSLFVLSNFGFAQETDTTVVTEVTEDEGNLPVRSPWATGLLIDNQTTETPTAKSLEFAIHHRFGKIEDISDLFGIYSSSNIRLGVTYGITDKIAVGFGTEKDHKMQEFTGKYKILSQTRNGKIPVSLTYFGNIVIDGRDQEMFTDSSGYKFIYRLSFFNQLIVSRKVTNAFSAQAGISFSHFNMVTELAKDSLGTDIPKWKNDYIGLSLGGRYKFYNNMSAIVEYNHPFSLEAAWENQSEPKPSLGIGLEIGTSTHAFQIFASNYRSIIPQENFAHNLNDMGNGDWFFGFNITVRM